jgi:hypothetical protein
MRKQQTEKKRSSLGQGDPSAGKKREENVVLQNSRETGHYRCKNAKRRGQESVAEARF